MINSLMRKSALVCASVSLISIAASERAMGQDASKQPFASLGNLMSEVKASKASLESLKQKLTNDQKKIKADEAAVSKSEKQLEQAKNEAKAAKQKVSPNKKWICNAFGYTHNDPSECSKPEQGGVWVTIDEDGNRSRYREPTQADLDRAKAADAKLAAAELDVAMKKAKLVDAERTYRADSEKFNTQTAELQKKVDSLSDPKKVVKDLQNVYNAAALKSGNVDPAMNQSIDKMADMAGKVNGTGQCAVLVQKYAGVGLTDDWKKGDSISAKTTIKPFTPAATFVKNDNGDFVYPNNPSGNHAVIVLDNTKDGLLVFDQYSGKEAGFRTLGYKGGTAANQDKIDKGEKEAKEAGLTPDDGKAYYRIKYKYYNPSNDADNYSYIK